ncbi:protein FAM200C-like [Palaemon carinicauda]|uniref:protein FAM200C-like n=1 Tax=Palaemon carinicauda TaxID=392227 RepID=UPI0035B59975
MTYERYQGPEDMEEEFLFCQPLQTTTTGEDIFMKVDSLFKEEGLLWRPCYSVCCDGAPAMLGARQGFIVSVKQENPSVMVVHCLLHHENLASLKLSHELQKVMQEVTQVAITRKGTQRLLEFWTETELFLTEKSHPLAHKFPESKWLMQVAYLADMFAEINSLNISMQGRDQTLVGLSEKLLAFKGKVKLWMNKIKSGKTASFPSFNLLLEDERFSLIQVQGIIEGHISKLIRECDHYIPENTLNYSWVRNPFNIEAEDLPDEIANISKLQQELSEIQNDATLHYNFKRQKESLSSFWIKVHKEKPNLRGEALKTLIPFATTFLSEAGFSALTVIKGKIQKPFATRR